MHTPPKFGSIRFSCPHCGALAHQYWSTLHAEKLEKDDTPTRYDSDTLNKIKTEQLKLEPEKRYSDFDRFDEYFTSISGEIFASKFRKDPYSYRIYNLETTTCDSCGKLSVWSQMKMIYPNSGPAGIASSDMPETVKSLFDEAGAVFNTSPRAAAALLRLSLQHLMVELGQTGKDIFADINSLIDNGLDEEIALHMHAVRIVGNESVHPGVIDVNDEPYIAEILFELLNQIVNQMITRPKRNQNLWEKLPEEKRKDVEKRLAKRSRDDLEK